jgi:mannose-1-phosphate guanylyltransferase
MNKERMFAVVMAGGRGERFWPQSRASHPKQLLSLIGNLTLIEQTVERLSPLVSPENTFVLTNVDYVAPMRSLLATIPPENVIGEPVGRDTGPCVALGAALVRAKSKVTDPVMVMLPADHVIRDAVGMRNVLEECADVADRGYVVTIAVKPTFPSTGYGYIRLGDKLNTGGRTVFRAGLGFREKPSAEVAEEFVRNGDHGWNSGIFVWTLATLCQAFRSHAPALARLTETLEAAKRGGRLDSVMATEFPKTEKISIDYAVMEKVERVAVAECTFDWDDVGSWTALRNQIRPEEGNNVVRGLHVGLDSSDCIIVGDANHLITTVDVHDLIIVHTEDATLVCRAKSAQRIKNLLQVLSERPDLSKFL